MQRPSWDQYFMGITRLVATRSTCMRRQVGAILVKDRNILATGYNGVPSGITHCDAVGCLRERLKVPSGERHELCRGLELTSTLRHFTAPPCPVLSAPKC